MYFYKVTRFLLNVSYNYIQSCMNYTPKTGFYKRLTNWFVVAVNLISNDLKQLFCLETMSNCQIPYVFF